MTFIACLIQGFLSLFSFIRFTQMSTMNPLNFLIFIVLVFVYYQFTKNQVACRITPSDKICSTCISILFSSLALFSKKEVLLLNSEFLIEQIAVMVLAGVGMFLMVYYFLLWIFMTTAEINITQNLYPSPFLPVLTFIGCILVWGFYFLYFYPGILPVATIQEYQQVQGLVPFSDRPSLIHAVLLDKLCKVLSLFLTSDIRMIAALTILQIVFLAFIAAYVIRTLQIAHMRTYLCVACVIFYLLPFHGIMASTLSNDVLFTANLTGYIAVLTRLFLKSDRRQYSKLKWASLIFCYLLFGFMTCTLSRIGLLVFLISLPFVLLALREKWKTTVFASAVILLLVAFIKYPFFYLYQIEKPTWFSMLNPSLQAIINHDADASLYDYLRSCSNLFYPSGAPLVYRVGIAPNDFALETASILHYPQVLMDTLLTMQACIPLYGLIWSSGNLFWVLIVSLFLCILRGKLENIAFGIPIFIIFVASCILSSGTLLFHNVYSIFLATPLFVFLSFIDAESEF